MTHLVVQLEDGSEFGVLMGTGWVLALSDRAGDLVVRLITAPISLEGNMSFEHSLKYIEPFEVIYSDELELRALIMGEVPFKPEIGDAQ